MKVFLTHSYFLHDDLSEQKIMKPYPTLGLLYISSYLKERKVHVDLFDTTFSSKIEQWESIIKSKPDLIAIYCNLMTKINVVKLIQEIKSQTLLSNSKVVVGGPDVTYNIENYLKAGADIVIIGEGEQTIYEVTKALEQNTSLEEVNGIAFLKDGNTFQTPSREKMKDLTILPLPDRESIPLEKYLDVWKTYHGKRTTNLSTQRGCPYTCKWCSTAVYGQSYRRRNPSQVADEIVYLKEKFQVESIWFVDDVFTVSHKWIDEFYNEMKSRSIDISFEIITRAERLNTDILTKLKEIGCFRIWIGAESGSQKIIDLMDRRVDVTQVQQMIIEAQKIGIEAGTFVMVGYPGETKEDIFLTAKHLEKSQPKHLTVTKAYPIKGTSLYTEIESKITSQPNWNNSTDRQIEFELPYSKKFYQNAIRYIYNRHQFSISTSYVQKLKFWTKGEIAKMRMM